MSRTHHRRNLAAAEPFAGARDRIPSATPPLISPQARLTLMAGEKLLIALREASDQSRTERSIQRAVDVGDGGMSARHQLIGPVLHLMQWVVRNELRLAALEMAEFNPAQPRVPAGSPDGGQWTSGESGGDTPDAIPVGDDHAKDTTEATRKKIADAALAQLNSHAWSNKKANGHFAAGTNKCNLFVSDILTKSGASPGLPNGLIHGYPPTAGQWADPTFDIPGWTMLLPVESPEPGDVAAQAIRYSDASGHVMIVDPGNTLIGTGSPPSAESGIIEQIPMIDDLSRGHARTLGPIRFRRWRG